MPLGLLASRILNQDAPHRLGSGAEKMSPAVPCEILGPDESKPGLMNERSRLKGLVRTLLRHLLRGEFAQFIVHERQQFIGGLGIALLGALKNARELAHWLSLDRETCQGKPIQLRDEQCRENTSVGEFPAPTCVPAICRNHLALERSCYV